MRLWVDADACPKMIKEILFRASARTNTSMILVANQPMHVPPNPLVQQKIVGQGFDVADQYIVENMTAGDLVVTADVPLANDVVEKGGTALNPRGVLYTKKNIKSCLAIRNFHEEMRSTQGHSGGGPAPLSKRDLQQFANHLDQFLEKHRHG